MPVIIHLERPKQQLFTSLAEGVRAPFDAVGYTFRQKGFWLPLLIVFIINGALFCGSIYLVFTQLYPVLKSFTPSVSGWYMVIVNMVSGTVITLVSLFCAVLLYAFSGTVLSSPLLDRLSVGTEKRLTGEKQKHHGLFYPFSEILRIVLMFVRGFLAVIVAVVVLFPLNLVPFAGNLLYSIVCLAAIGFFTGSPFFSYPLDRRRVDSGSKMLLLWKYKWTVIGTGVAFLVLSFVPLLGFVSHCVTSVGAATLFREKILPYIELSHEPDEA